MSTKRLRGAGLHLSSHGTLPPFPRQFVSAHLQLRCYLQRSLCILTRSNRVPQALTSSDKLTCVSLFVQNPLIVDHGAQFPGRPRGAGLNRPLPRNGHRHRPPPLQALQELWLWLT